MNLEKIAQTLDFEIGDVVMLMDIFLQNAQESLDTLEKAIQVDDFLGIENEAHAIKGSAANLLLQNITKIALNMEQLARDKSATDYISLYKNLKNEINSLVNLEVST